MHKQNDKLRFPGKKNKNSWVCQNGCRVTPASFYTFNAILFKPEFPHFKIKQTIHITKIFYTNMLNATYVPPRAPVR